MEKQELVEGMQLELSQEEVEKLAKLIAAKKDINDISDKLREIRDWAVAYYDKLGDALFDPIIERYGINAAQWKPDVDEKNLTIKLAKRQRHSRGNEIARLLEDMLGGGAKVVNLSALDALDDDDTSIRVKE